MICKICNENNTNSTSGICDSCMGIFYPEYLPEHLPKDSTVQITPVLEEEKTLDLEIKT